MKNNNNNTKPYIPIGTKVLVPLHHGGDMVGAIVSGVRKNLNNTYEYHCNYEGLGGWDTFLEEDVFADIIDCVNNLKKKTKKRYEEELKKINKLELWVAGRKN